VVTAWAMEGDFDVGALKSNLFEMEWPPKSGRRASFPEVDRAEWFSIDAARKKILPGQSAFLDRLLSALGAA
jgi:predicted NUDIX family NTP pyrophosphohydrolase